MSDLQAEEQAEVERLAQPTANEADILEPNKVRDEALKTIAKETVAEKEEEEEEIKLPKLSAAEFRAYNSMAEHMEYFVRLSSIKHSTSCRNLG